eukprot:gene9028-6330_t
MPRLPLPFLALRPRCRIIGDVPASALLSRYVWSAKWLREMEPEAARAYQMNLSQLMVRAGTAAYQATAAAYPGSRHWLILVGPGNNGGDGYVVAKLAKEDGRHVTVLAMKTSGALPVEAANAKGAWEAAGGTSVVYDPDAPPPLPHVRGAAAHSATDRNSTGAKAPPVDLVVDGLLGTGITGAPREGYARLIEEVNGLPVPRVAIDIPSGLNAETGEAAGCCVRAQHTTSFISLKPGLLTAQARAYTGQLHYASLGLEAWLADPARREAAAGRRLTVEELPDYFPAPRSEVAHKGTSGKVLLVGGDSGFGGAIMMAAEACMAAGAGLTRVLTRPEHVAPLLTRCPEVMVEGIAVAPSSSSETAEAALVTRLRQALDWCTCVAVGPGLGTSPDFGRVVLREVLSHAREHRAKAVIVDADGLNLLAALRSEEEGKERGEMFHLGLPQLIITPHPGEASRLLGCSIAEVEKDRVASAERLAALTGGICLLKGPGTVVRQHGALPYAILDAGSAAMAVGGMGDVLTGVIAGLAAQGVDTPSLFSETTAADLHPLFHVTCAGGLVHACAADVLRETVPGHGTRGLRATELLAFVTASVNIADPRPEPENNNNNKAQNPLLEHRLGRCTLKSKTEGKHIQPTRGEKRHVLLITTVPVESELCCGLCIQSAGMREGIEQQQTSVFSFAVDLYITCIASLLFFPLSSFRVGAQHPIVIHSRSS